MEDMSPLLDLPFTDLEQLYLSNSPIRANYLLGPLLRKVRGVKIFSIRYYQTLYLHVKIIYEIL
jgi:hypothetical protein